MFKLRQIVLSIVLAPALAGCAMIFPGWHQNWQETDRKTVTDPVTGDLTRTFTWRYDDGSTAETTEIIPRDQINSRRLDVRPTPPRRESPE